MKKNRKFLITAIPLAILLLGVTVYEYGYLQVRKELTALEETALGKKKVLRKCLTLIAEKPRLDTDLIALTAVREAERTKTIEGQTPSIAAAAMQNIVNGLITASGGTVTSERIEKAEDLGNFKKITVSVDATLPDIRALSYALFTIETQTPYLVIREVDASTRNYMAPKEMTIRLKISGLTGGK